jgi:hypothetical protein
MSDFNIRSDSVNVEEIMQQIRARIREKRGVDYTEQEIRELAAVKLEKFLDPSKVRSDLLEQYRHLQRDQATPNVELDEETLFGSPRPWLRRVRRLLRPILKLFVNPVPLMRAARLDTVRHAELFYELMHNLVVETTRLSIEVKTLKMRVESLSSRLDFDERRARALEGTVQYRPAAAPAQGGSEPPAGREDEEGVATESLAARSRRRRRRRGRRGGQRGGMEEPSAGTTTGGESEAPDATPQQADTAPRGDGLAEAAGQGMPTPGPDVPARPAPPAVETRRATDHPADRDSQPRQAGHTREGEPGDQDPGA